MSIPSLSLPHSVILFSNEQEFCRLLHLVSRDKCFRDFLVHNEKNVARGHQKKSTKWEKQSTVKLLGDLQKMAVPYLLQRSLNATLKEVLPSKEEYVVWIKPSKAQCDATEKILKSEKTEDARDNLDRFSVFAIIARLRMIAFHPYFATKRTDAEIKSFWESKEQENSEENNCDDDDVDKHFELDTGNCPAQILGDSPMFQVCRDKIKGLIAGGHKVLVFSLFRKPLQLLSHVIKHLDDIGSYEINGTVSQNKRDQSIEDFNRKTSSHQVMFCTIGSGGLGLTLTGADRVILLGASYNPMEDAQAVARAYRIGQDRPVVVYRLLMESLIDEKVSRPAQFPVYTEHKYSHRSHFFRYMESRSRRWLSAKMSRQKRVAACRAFSMTKI